MGFLDFFKRKDTQPEANQENSQLRIHFTSGYDLLHIWDLGFGGRYSKSSNERYIVACQDPPYHDDGEGNFKESGCGIFILLKDQKLVYQKEMERPYKAAVSNTGIVALYHIGFGENPKAHFCLFDKDANELMKYEVDASSPKYFIDERGELAWLVTGNNQVFLFSVSPPRFLFQIDDFDALKAVQGHDGEIHVDFRGILRRYDTAGILRNSDDVEKAELEWFFKSGEPYRLERKADDILSTGDFDSLEETKIKTIRSLLETATQKESETWYKAKLHRKLGEFLERIEDKVGALKQYTIAVEYDPKVGCKRALGRLEKEMG